MRKSVDIFFDYVCPYCYIASKREAIIKKELDLDFHWKPWEIYPERPREAERRRYLEPSFIVKSLADEIDLEISLPIHQSNSHIALMGMLYAKSIGKFDGYHSGIFRKHWEEKKDISELSVLREVCRETGIDFDELKVAIASPEIERFLHKLDLEAVRRKVELVPSYMLDGKIVVGNIPLADLMDELREYLES